MAALSMTARRYRSPGLVAGSLTAGAASMRDEALPGLCYAGPMVGNICSEVILMNLWSMIFDLQMNAGLSAGSTVLLEQAITW